MTPTTSKLADPGALIRSAKLPEKDFPVCVEPDLVAEYEQLVQMRDAAKEVGAGSLSGGATADLDEQIDAVQELMAEATVTLRLRALGRRRWRDLRDEHPPRKDDDGTVLPADLLGVNYDAFFAALVRESLIQPALDAETIDVLLDEKITDRQWIDLTDVAWNLNEARISVPFSPAVSPSRTNSAPK
jgi:hypothetical protein